MPRLPSDRPTSRDVAALAGVSQPTVSRALRGDKAVSEALRTRIQEAAQQLKYIPDRNASQLRTGRTQTIALIILCRVGEDKASINPFYFALLGCIAAAAAERRYDLIVSFQENFQENSYQESGQADGVIVIGSAENIEGWNHYKDMAMKGKNIICWGTPDEDIAAIASDNIMGGILATDHLVELGRQKIVFIGPISAQQNQFHDRYLGYCDSIAKHGLIPYHMLISTSSTREQQGYDSISKLIETGQDFDGIFAANDLLALGAMQSLLDHGISIPQSVSVVGFDGIHAGSLFSPTLTSIEQNLQSAANILVDRLLSKDAISDLRTSAIPVQLKIRGSSVPRV